MSGASAGRMYDVTPETYEALDEFRFMPQRKTNWNLLTNEMMSNFGFSGTYNQETVVQITGLDLEKIINKIYGTRTEEGVFQYQANPVQLVANVNGEYVVVEKVQHELLERPINVYNFQVAGDHTYYVSDVGVWGQGDGSIVP